MSSPARFRSSARASPPRQPNSTDGTAEHLLNGYAFSSAHAAEAQGSLSAVAPQTPLKELANGENILLSFAGGGGPRVHELVNFTCFSSDTPGIATWVSRRDFFDQRVRLRDALLELHRREGGGLFEDDQLDNTRGR